MSDHNHYIMRINNGDNFKASSIYKIWGINSSASKKFLENVRKYDTLWFVLDVSANRPIGSVLAMATINSANPRILQCPPICSKTMTNDELGWVGDGKWDYEIHYTDLYDLSNYKLNISNLNISGEQRSTRLYNERYSDYEVFRNGIKTNLFKQYDAIPNCFDQVSCIE